MVFKLPRGTGSFAGKKSVYKKKKREESVAIRTPQPRQSTNNATEKSLDLSSEKLQAICVMPVVSKHLNARVRTWDTPPNL